MLKTVTKVVTLTIACLFLIPGVSALAQSKRLINRNQLPDEPLDVVELRAHGVPVEFGKPFDADDQWLSGISFKVKNVSGKAIAHLSLRLAKPPENGLNFNIPLRAGYFDPFAANPIHGTILNPNETLDIGLDDRVYEGFMSRLPNEYSRTSLAQIDFSIESVVFTDGTRWHLGMILQRDPNQPNMWYPLPGEKERFEKKMRDRSQPGGPPPSGFGRLASQISSSDLVFLKIGYASTSVARRPVAQNLQVCVNWLAEVDFNCGTSCSWGSIGGLDDAGDNSSSSCYATTDIMGGTGPYAGIGGFTSCTGFLCFCGITRATTASYMGDCVAA